MNRKMLITLFKPFYDIFKKTLLPLLNEKGFEVVLKIGTPTVDKNIILNNIKDVRAFIVCSEIIDKEVLREANKLKIISKLGAGVDNIDLIEAKKRNIAVTNTPGGNSISVAELVIGMMISLSRQLPISDKKMKINEWDPYLGSEINGKTLGIIGLGNIGKEIIKRLKCFNMKFLAYDIVRNDEFAKRYNVNFVSMDELIINSDFITIHVPLNDHTKNMINERELKSMKRNAFVINTARGGIINEKALYNALKRKVIKGAALDVFVEEPNKNVKLVCLKELIATPHIGGTTTDCAIREGKMAIDDIINYFEDREPVYLVI